MRPLLLLFLFAFAVSAPVDGAEATAARTNYLALRGSGRGAVEFNEFRSAGAGAARLDASRSPGYLAWKNTCRPVARMAVGGSFELGGERGFAGVMPYVLLPQPVDGGWLELLATEFATPVDKWAGKLGNG